MYFNPFSPLSYVLHYGPNEGSKTGKEEVMEYLHGLPPDNWKEPDPTDPLSIVDQVIQVFLEEIFIDIFHFLRWNFLLPMVVLTQ